MAKSVISKNKTRLTLDLAPRTYERLENLQDFLEADSKSAVLRQSLHLFDYCTRRAQEGWSIEAVSSDGERERIVVLC